ncbi:MAG: hypothetical protein AAGC46_00285 [Solirubrobacteraceae bacterium]|nr:hypothetical protein [Patulibacter sp.]
MSLFPSLRLQPVSPGTTTTRRRARRLARRRATATAALVALPLAATALSGCGGPDVASGSPHSGPPTDAAVLDVSESVRGSVMASVYAPAATAFAKASLDRGTKRLCVAYGGKDVIAGADKCMVLDAGDGGPADAARAAQSLKAFDAGIAAIGAQRSSLAGGSAILEMIAAVAPTLHAGSRLLVVSDMVENSPEVGDFAAGRLQFDDRGRAQLLARLRKLALVPSLHGVTVIAPFPLMHGNVPSNLDARRQAEIREVWEAWAAATGATLVWNGQPDA